MVQAVEGEPTVAATGAGVAASRRDHWLSPTYVVLALIVVLAAVLRLWGIGGQALWYDELVTTRHLSDSLGNLLVVSVPKLEGSPPLSFVVAWFWAMVFGDGDGAVRSLYAIEGIVAVPVVFVLARELRLSRRIALVAALLIATNPMLIWYSREARPYSLLFTLGAVSLWLCVRARNQRTTSAFLWWGIASAAALTTHYFAALTVVPEVVWLGYLVWRDREARRRFGIGCIPLALLAIPLALLALAQQGKQQAWIADFPVGLRLGEAGRTVLLGPAQPFEPWWPVGAVALAAIVGFALWRGTDLERRVIALAAGLVVAALVLTFLPSVVGSDYFLGRNLIVSMVPILVAVAIGLGTKRAGWLGLVAAIVIAAVWVGIFVRTETDGRFQKADWRAVADVVATGPRDRAVVVDSYLGSPILRYLDGSRSLPEKRAVKVRAIDLVYHIPAPEPHCGRWSGLACEAFFFPGIPKSLEKTFPLVDRVEFDGFVVNRYRSDHPVIVSDKRLLVDGKVRRGFILLPDHGPKSFKVKQHRKDRGDADHG
jgi:mannosyltransferase